MNNPETVAIDSVSAPKLDSLYAQQQQDIKNMRSALLDCNRTDAKSVKSAMRNILVMRLYHQMARIIRFTEEMDQVEDRMYHELHLKLKDPSLEGSEALILLLTIQERMQKLMVESQKLLDPYMNLDLLNMVDVDAQAEEDDSYGAKILSQESRQNIRSNAQQIMNLLNESTDKVDSDG
jgi:hypothetical protein